METHSTARSIGWAEQCLSLMDPVSLPGSKHTRAVETQTLLNFKRQLPWNFDRTSVLIALSGKALEM